MKAASTEFQKQKKKTKIPKMKCAIHMKVAATSLSCAQIRKTNEVTVLSIGRSLEWIALVYRIPSTYHIHNYIHTAAHSQIRTEMLTA